MPEDSAQVDPERGLGIIESFEMSGCLSLFLSEWAMNKGYLGEEPQSEASSNRSAYPVS